MLDFNEIRDTISQLENSKTTYDTCSKLADLYIVLDHSENANVQDTKSNDTVVNELSDILPAYTEYVKVKTNYKLNRGTKDSVLYSMDLLDKEITEFIDILFSSSDMSEERELLKRMLSNLYNKYR